MDPNEAHSLLMDALEEGDMEGLKEHSDNLMNWIANDGFMPEGAELPSKSEYYQFLRGIWNVAHRWYHAR